MSQATAKPDLVPTMTLVPVLNERWALGVGHLAATAVFGLFFLFLNYLPLGHTDLWGHVAYGRTILDAQALPAEDFMMPLAEGMPLVDYAWLSQVVFAAVESLGGAEGLSILFALTVFATHLILTYVFYLQIGSLGMSVLGMLLLVVIGWSRISTIRPEIFGIFCFATLFLLLVRKKKRQESFYVPPYSRLMWLAVPLLFSAWANLHGSFLCGLAVLGCLLLGRATEIGWSSRSLWVVFEDRAARRWLILTELAVAGTLLNPYGVDLLIYTVRFGGTENLRQVMEWLPMTILGVGGLEFAFSWVLLLVVLRHSLQRVRPQPVFLLMVFGVAAVASIRMMGWYAAVFTIVIMPHLREIAARQRWGFQEGGRWVMLVRRSWHWSFACLLVLWITFSFSSLRRPVLGGPARTEAQLYTQQTPKGVSRYLRENPPEGQIFNPQWWGDWLVWDGPSGLQPFVTTNLHLVPRLVWNDYLAIANAQPGWEHVLDRYATSTVVVDRSDQPLLVRAMRDADDWVLRYEDEQGQVYVRMESSHE